jgi:hypothetical protein
MSQSRPANGYSTFPDALAPTEEKLTQAYGLAWAKAIYAQWMGSDSTNNLYGKRFNSFETSRAYANGTQDTQIYRQILNSINANNGDGTLLTLDYTPVPIVPKFAKIVVNKILSQKPYPQVEAVDPLSQSEKDIKKKRTVVRIENIDMIREAKESGLDVDVDPDDLPQTKEETEIFLDTNVKTDAEVAAQLAAELTLQWNDFDEKIFRRAVEDLVTCGVAVVKRENDPNYGIKTNYVDPAYFLHSYTTDPNLNDLVYAGDIKRISISELKRTAGSQFTEAQYKEIAKTVMNKYGNDPNAFMSTWYDNAANQNRYGYDEFSVQVLEFEFKSVDSMVYENKESRFGNAGFYYKGDTYEAPRESVYDRKPVFMNNETVYGGKYVLGTDYLYDYGQKKNVPKNIYDISRARLSYSMIALNMRDMMPKSLVSSVIGFADMLQITHLKLQQSIAKAKPDGLVIDIEGLENVQLGRGGELQPLEIQDIYEQTGVFYYRSKNPEGGFQNPPVREIQNQIRNISELVNIYNHYLRMIRDATGINEVMDGTTPKGDVLVGVQKQALAAGNNALYDIQNAAMVLFRRVVEDIVKCVQIMPDKSILYKMYENAIGETNMAVLSSFKRLTMYNFGVKVITEMSDPDRAYLEQNLNVALQSGQLDLTDIQAIRQLRDPDQAERLMAVRIAKRRDAKMQEQQMQAQMTAQSNIQATNAAAQAEIQKKQVELQLDLQKASVDAEVKLKVMEVEHLYEMELAKLRGEYSVQQQQIETAGRENLEAVKETRKDDRIKLSAVEQSKLISQRKGERDELSEETDDLLDVLLNE